MHMFLLIVYMQREIMGTSKQCQVDICTHKSVDNPFTHNLFMELSYNYVQDINYQYLAKALLVILNCMYNHMAQILM